MSHALIKARPDLRVYWNDFDDYMARLEHLPETEELRTRMASALGPRGNWNKRGYNHVASPYLDADQTAAAAGLRRAHEARFGFIDPYVWQWTCELPGQLDSRLPRNSVPVAPLPLKRAEAYARVLRPARVRFDVMDFKPPAGAFYVIDPPYESTAQGAYGGHYHDGLRRVIAEAVSGGRSMVFCGIHEAEAYAAMFGGPYRRHELLIRGCSFNNAQRVEVCLSQWPS